MSTLTLGEAVIMMYNYLQHVNLSYWLMIVGGTFVVLTLIDYVCRMAGFKITPTFLLDKATFYSRKIFQYLGEFTAVISSFYIKLKLHELFASAINIIVATFSFCLSPFYFFYGYIKKSLTYVGSNSILIYIGSATIVCFTACGLIYYFWNEITFTIIYELVISYQMYLSIAGCLIMASPFVYGFINDKQNPASSRTSSGTSSGTSSRTRNYSYN